MSLTGGVESNFAEHAGLLSIILYDLFVCNNN